MRARALHVPKPLLSAVMTHPRTGRKAQAHTLSLAKRERRTILRMDPWMVEEVGHSAEWKCRERWLRLEGTVSPECYPRVANVRRG